ncbi:hypothetical protein [Bradyrhizobium lupini]|uniref:hypothetical protein n=1 Tax=Rhizobium lupini TaxID=136996 RepID=UPI0034C698D9
MIKPILFASIALALIGGAVQAQQGAPCNPQDKNWKGASSSLPDAVFRVRAEEEREKVAQAGVRDRRHAREAKLTKRLS